MYFFFRICISFLFQYMLIIIGKIPVNSNTSFTGGNRWTISGYSNEIQCDTIRSTISLTETLRAADHHEKSLYFHCTSRDVQNRLILQGLNGHAAFEEPSLGNISAAVSIELDHQSFLQCWQIWHHRHFAGLSFGTKNKQQIFYILTSNWNQRFFSIAVTVHAINTRNNQTAIIYHSKMNCGQSQTA